jgi:GNAT superfamily N-acetyltransferase
MTTSSEGRTESGLLVFRLATPADADLLPQVAGACYLPWYDYLWHPGERDAYLARTYDPATVRNELADPNVVVEFACRDGRPVGFSKLERRRDRSGLTNAAHLERVYVGADAGRGVGTRLIERALARAQADGRESVWLRAMDSAVRPLERYLALGFRGIGVERLEMPGMRAEYRGMRVLARTL